jgi:hypothetical protein
MLIDYSRLIRNQYFQFIIYLLSPLVEILFFIFMLFVNPIKRICWEVYLLFTRLPPTQAWMDPREQTLMIKYIQALKQKKK